MAKHKLAEQPSPVLNDPGQYRAEALAPESGSVAAGLEPLVVSWLPATGKSLKTGPSAAEFSVERDFAPIKAERVLGYRTPARKIEASTEH